jgi:hypothetical protein
MLKPVGTGDPPVPRAGNPKVTQWLKNDTHSP